MLRMELQLILRVGARIWGGLMASGQSRLRFERWKDRSIMHCLKIFGPLYPKYYRLHAFSW